MPQISKETGGKLWHTRNRHLRNHRGFSVACSNGLSVAFSNGCSIHQWHFPADCRFPRIVAFPVDFRGSFQWMFRGIFQHMFTFVSSGVQYFAPRDPLVVMMEGFLSLSRSSFVQGAPFTVEELLCRRSSFRCKGRSSSHAKEIFALQRASLPFN